KRLSGRFDNDQLEAMLHACLARVELTRGRDAAAMTSLLPILWAHAKSQPLPVPADRLAGALAERGDPKAAIELLTAAHNDSARGPTTPPPAWILDSTGSSLISGA